MAAPSKSVQPLSLLPTTPRKLIIPHNTYHHSSPSFSIRLLGNIVGIDEKLAVDGNDSIEKSSFQLSPAAARASSTVPKTKKQAQTENPASPKKRLFNSHRSSVSNISDLRLHKRGRINKDTKDEDCIIIDSDSDVENPHLLNACEQKQKAASQTLVTPSPHPSRRQTQQKQQPNDTPLYNSSRSSSQRGNEVASGRTTSPHFATNASGKNRGVRNQSSSWFQQRKQQKTSQLSAFNSPKENPFSSYSFDPNSIEKSLDSMAVRSKEQSIFPHTMATSNITATKPRDSRTFRTPASRRKNAASSSRISSHDLLQRKANELNQQQHQMTLQESVSGPFDHSTWTVGNRFAQAYDVGNYEHDHFSRPHQQFRQQQQQYVQPPLNSFRSNFHEDSFDHRRGPFGHHQYEYSQQMPRPGISNASVMTSNRFMNMPYRQQFIQRQHSSFHPTYRYHDEESFDQGYSIGGHEIPQQMHYRPGTSLGSLASDMTSHRFMNMPPSQQFTQPSQFRHEYITRNYVEHDTQNYLRAAEESSSHHGYMRSAPVQNPYLPQNGGPRAAGSVVNPYRQHNQDAISGPPMEVLVQNRAADESQFEDAFF